MPTPFTGDENEETQKGSQNLNEVLKNDTHLQLEAFESGMKDSERKTAHQENREKRESLARLVEGHNTSSDWEKIDGGAGDNELVGGAENDRAETGDFENINKIIRGDSPQEGGWETIVDTPPRGVRIEFDENNPQAENILTYTQKRVEEINHTWQYGTFDEKYQIILTEGQRLENKKIEIETRKIDQKSKRRKETLDRRIQEIKNDENRWDATKWILTTWETQAFNWKESDLIGAENAEKAQLIASIRNDSHRQRAWEAEILRNRPPEEAHRLILARNQWVINEVERHHQAYVQIQIRIARREEEKKETTAQTAADTTTTISPDEKAEENTKEKEVLPEEIAELHQKQRNREGTDVLLESKHLCPGTQSIRPIGGQHFYRSKNLFEYPNNPSQTCAVIYTSTTTETIPIVCYRKNGRWIPSKGFKNAEKYNCFEKNEKGFQLKIEIADLLEKDYLLGGSGNIVSSEIAQQELQGLTTRHKLYKQFYA